MLYRRTGWILEFGLCTVVSIACLDCVSSGDIDRVSLHCPIRQYWLIRRVVYRRPEYVSMDIEICDGITPSIRCDRAITYPPLGDSRSHVCAMCCDAIPAVMFLLNTYIVACCPLHSCPCLEIECKYVCSCIAKHRVCVAYAFAYSCDDPLSQCIASLPTNIRTIDCVRCIGWGDTHRDKSSIRSRYLLSCDIVGCPAVTVRLICFILSATVVMLDVVVVVILRVGSCSCTCCIHQRSPSTIDPADRCPSSFCQRYQLVWRGCDWFVVVDFANVCMR